MPDLEAPPPAAVAADSGNESDASEGFDHFLEFLQSPPGETAATAARPLNPTGTDIVEGGAKLVGLALGQEKGAEKATGSSSPRAGDGKDQLYAGKSKSYMEMIKEKQLSKKELKKAEKGKKKGKKKSDVPPATKDQPYGGKNKSYKSLIKEKQQSKKELGSLTNHSSRLPTKQNPSMNSSERSGLSQTNLRAAFDTIDADGSGQISKRELRTSLQSSAIDGSFYGEESGEFEALFNAIDTDKSGTVDFKEYSSFMERVMEFGGTGTPKKSCMKVSTLEDSLDSCNNKKKPSKKKQVVRRSFFARGSGRNRAENSVLLDSMHSQQSNLRACRQLSIEDVADIANSKAGRQALGVRFFDVEVRKYEVTVSDHPCVSSGTAVELGWRYSVMERTHLDTFETKRSGERAANFKREKRLTPLERQKILREFGATKTEIQVAGKRAAILRSKRRQSIQSRHLDKKHEKIEKLGRGLKRVFSSVRRSGKKELTEEVDMERLHPTLLVLMGEDGHIATYMRTTSQLDESIHSGSMAEQLSVNEGGLDESIHSTPHQ